MIMGNEYKQSLIGLIKNYDSENDRTTDHNIIVYNNDVIEMLMAILNVVDSKPVDREDLISRLVDLKRHSSGAYKNAVRMALDLV